MNLKKCISLFIVGLMISFLVSTSVFATSQECIEKNNFSEYDYIVEIRKMSERKLDTLDLPLSEKRLICSDAIENEILSRKQLSDDVLITYYGYTNDEIAILRSYKGGRLEDHEELRAITGTLTIDQPIVMISSTKNVAVKVYWTWDHKPFVCRKDVLGATWSPTFKDGKYGNLTFNSSRSNHTLFYGNGTVSDSKTVSVINIVPDHAVKSEFSLYGDFFRVDIKPLWAKSGTFNLYLKTAANDVSLSQVSFVFAYGHTILTFSPSISFDYSGPGFGISFGTGTSLADLRSGYVKAGKKIWYQ